MIFLAPTGPRDMSITFPGESPDYRAARNRLLEHEIRLRRQIEAVAEERRRPPPGRAGRMGAAAEGRRRLPRGGAVPHDYVFEEAGHDPVRMSELFAPGRDA